ncbi:MAG: transglycosylase SLT domain-containing protein [candidate division Zixibacteria bacterium]|nr:transglycosylase SLT domain-containing protein [candidate division Zixibacteria bacterium]
MKLHLRGWQILLLIMALMVSIGINVGALGRAVADSIAGNRQMAISPIARPDPEISHQVNQTVIREIERAAFRSRALAILAEDKSAIADAIFELSPEYGFQPAQIMALVEIESGGDPRAISHTGDYGLMQVNLHTWQRELGLDRHRILETKYNLRSGLEILRRYHREAGDFWIAVHRYNNGYRGTDQKYLQKAIRAIRRRP